MNKFLNWFYNKIRFLFVDDIDPNEDFICAICNKPVLKRVLTCSNNCSEKYKRYIGF